MAGVLGAALVACVDSGGGSGAVSPHFTWWRDEDLAEATQRAVDLFEERDPGITVTTSFASYESYVEKLVAGGAAPDLIGDGHLLPSWVRGARGSDGSDRARR